MIQDLTSFEFHNVATPEPWPIGGGYLLPRYPEKVRHVINNRGRFVSQDSVSVEIRFLTDAPTLRVYLSAPNAPMDVHVYYGSFFVQTQKIESTVDNVFITIPERFAGMKRQALESGPFHPRLWRIVGDRNALVFHGVDTFGHAVRPPTAKEKPRQRWLAYGSSITHSTWNGYPQQAAWRLGIDVQNKGMSGACHIEPQVADFIATGCEWDILTAELGINVRGFMEPAEFEKRTRYLLERCMQAKPGRPIVLITSFTNLSEHQDNPGSELGRERAYDELLRGFAKEFAGNNVHLVEGKAMVPQLHLLSQDLVHPTGFGQVRMGEILAERLRPLLGLA